MLEKFSLSDFQKLYPDNEACLDEIATLRYPNGVYCRLCKRKTTHYKISGRTAYACKECRNQVYPLKGTIYEKTSTPHMQRKRQGIKDKKLRTILAKGGRNDARKDFFELLKRSVRNK